MEMEFMANKDKNVDIVCGGRVYQRHAVKTRFVNIGDDYIELIKKYVVPAYRPGYILSISEKIIALCQGRVVWKKDMRLSHMAKFLSRFVMKTPAGLGVGNPYKMQFAIDYAGRAKVLYAAVAAGIGKLFRKKGIFYDILGPEIKGIDGFYSKAFPIYGEMGIRIPASSGAVCEEIYKKTGIPCMIVDANDLERDILGKSASVYYDDESLLSMISDNPAGQSDQMTPFILIREAPAMMMSA